jgi:trk system potassium uptake protein TrkH
MPNMARLTGPMVKYPARLSFAWYFAAIVVGALLLMRPESRAADRPDISAVDAAFTATSAVCVTGLGVRSTGHDYSWLGQLVILALIQLGGIGIITVTTFVTFRIGSSRTLRQRALVSETLGGEGTSDLSNLVRDVIRLSLFVEGLGFLVLLTRNLFDQPFLTAAWHALFHSVSAFCNAGFALHDDSLVRYQGDPVVNFTIAALIIIGGIGFPVILDLRDNWHGPWQRRWERLRLHTKLMLLGTIGLIALGTVLFLVFEWDNSLREMSIVRGFMVAVFQSITCRTAGFNTIDIAGLTNATLFLMVLLMIAGAGPCSAGGGLKVSTLMLLLARVWSTFRGYTRINLFRRTIPTEVAARAISTALVFGVVVFAALMVLLALEQTKTAHTAAGEVFLDALFEVVSALCTVGLSTGITPALGDAAKSLLIVAMFLGRLGPITVFIVFSRAERDTKISYPEERPLIG